MKILLVIDMQKDFVDGALGTPEAVAIVPNVKARIEQALKDDERIIFTRDTHTEQYLQTQEGRKLPVPHCIKGSDGWQITEQLRPFAEQLRVIDKPGFGSIDLCRFLWERSQFMPIESITLVGLCTDVCIISNAMLLKATMPETDIFVEAACCAGITPESHLNALEAMKMCQIDII